MKILAIAMQKGGVGKSTLTRSLAVAATEAGLNVLALDMDPQQSTNQWGERRQAQLPAVSYMTEVELPKALQRAEAAGCDVVIIDTPPARSSEAPAAVESADYVLMPCTPDIEAYEQLPRTVRLARTCAKPAAVVLTLATPNSRSEEDTATKIFEVMKAQMAPVTIRRLKVHRDACREGLTALEAEPNGKAAAEIRALWEWVSAELQIGNSAIEERKIA